MARVRLFAAPARESILTVVLHRVTVGCRAVSHDCWLSLYRLFTYTSREERRVLCVPCSCREDVRGPNEHVTQEELWQPPRNRNGIHSRTPRRTQSSWR